MTSQESMIEDKIDPVMRIVKCDPFLSAFKTKPSPHLLCLQIYYVKQ